MAIEFRCVNCQKMLRVGDDAVGKKARCPDCGAIQSIGAAFPEPAGPLTAADVGLNRAAAPSSTLDASLDRAPSPFSKPTAQTTANPFGDNARYGYGVGASNPYAGSSLPGEAVVRPDLIDPAARLIAEQRVKAPALALMVVQSLGLCLIAFQVVSVIVQAANNQFQPEVLFGMAMILIGAAVNGIGLFGAWRMYNLRDYGWAMTSAILAIIPCFSFGCCFLSLPCGIWALVVLVDPAVKNAFQ